MSFLVFGLAWLGTGLALLGTGLALVERDRDTGGATTPLGRRLGNAFMEGMLDPTTPLDRGLHLAAVGAVVAGSAAGALVFAGFAFVSGRAGS